MCERTAEYVLVSALETILLQKYGSTFPFYFSGTREGSAVAELGESLKVVAVFARRPKILTPCAKEIYIKFNERLFEVAQKARCHGIPVIAGVPLVSSLGCLADKPPCAWFLIQSQLGKPGDVIHKLDLTRERLLTENREGVEGPLGSSRLLEHIEMSAQSYRWPAAVQVLRELRRTDDGRLLFFPFGGSPYRPFFFALLEQK
jgi:hypothetical protein